jgi:hypothetical protein
LVIGGLNSFRARAKEDRKPVFEGVALANRPDRVSVRLCDLRTDLSGSEDSSVAVVDLARYLSGFGINLGLVPRPVIHALKSLFETICLARENEHKLTPSGWRDELGFASLEDYLESLGLEDEAGFRATQFTLRDFSGAQVAALADMSSASDFVVSDPANPGRGLSFIASDPLRPVAIAGRLRVFDNLPVVPSVNLILGRKLG